MPNREPALPKVFISHSSHDKVLAEALLKLLRQAFMLTIKEVRCTSLTETQLPPGVEIDPTLRKELSEAKSVIALLTDDSLRSHYVLFEMGARWGMEKSFLPLLPNKNYDLLSNSPLKGLHTCCLDDENSIFQLLQTLAPALKKKLQPAPSFTAEKDNLLLICRGYGLQNPKQYQPNFIRPILKLGCELFARNAMPHRQVPGSALRGFLHVPQRAKPNENSPETDCLVHVAHASTDAVHDLSPISLTDPECKTWYVNVRSYWARECIANDVDWHKTPQILAAIELPQNVKSVIAAPIFDARTNAILAMVTFDAVYPAKSMGWRSAHSLRINIEAKRVMDEIRDALLCTCQ